MDLSPRVFLWSHVLKNGTDNVMVSDSNGAICGSNAKGSAGLNPTTGTIAAAPKADAKKRATKVSNAVSKHGPARVSDVTVGSEKASNKRSALKLMTNSPPRKRPKKSSENVVHQSKSKEAKTVHKPKAARDSKKAVRKPKSKAAGGSKTLTRVSLDSGTSRPKRQRRSVS